MWEVIKNLVGIIVSAIVGMLIEAFLNNPVENLIQKTRKSIFKFYYSKKKVKAMQNYKMQFGDVGTSIRVIDGDGHSTFRDENIKIFIQESTPFEWPEEVGILYNKTCAELEERQKHGGSIPWDGDVLSLYRYNVQRTPNYEDNAITIYLAKTQYYYPYATITNLNDTLRSKYMNSIDSGADYRLPNAFGVSFLARTIDNKAIFAIRSSASGYRPGESDVTVVEGINPQLDMNGHTLVISNVVRRAFVEEICNIENSRISIINLGLLLDEKYNQWNFVGIIDVGITHDEIIYRRNHGTNGKWELKSLDFIEFKPRPIFEYFSKHKIWDMGIATTYFALINQYNSYEEVEKMASRYLMQ